MKEIDRPVVFAAGCLDGVHKGHQEVIETAVSRAHNHGAETWVLTFDPHPLEVLRPDKAPPLLTRRDQKLAFLKEVGVDGSLVIPFTEEFSQWEADRFIEELNRHIPSLAEIVVGENWTFGRHARGDVDLLKRLAPVHGYKVTVVSPILWQGEPISSTRIRQAIQAGNLQEALHMLGRPFSVRGKVIEGLKLGRELGFPTANIAIDSRQVGPQPGIYAVFAVIDGERCDGAAYYGRRPTFPDAPHELSMEVHLFDWTRELYNQEVEVFFIKFLREDARFDERKALIAQIEKDVKGARKVLRRHEEFSPVI